MKQVGDNEPALVPPHVRGAAGLARIAACCCTSARSTGRRPSSSTARTVGTHRGGYDAFDVRHHRRARRRTGPQEIVVSVWDPTDAGTQPRGKQVNRPGGIWYTPVTGIWQTVWIEPVPRRRHRLADDRAGHRRRVARRDDDGRDDGKRREQRRPRRDRNRARRIARSWPSARRDRPAASTCRCRTPKLWSPDTPTLYGPEGHRHARRHSAIDDVTSYFAMRKSSLGKDDSGVLRLCLNNKPLFQVGPLDQGWWPDGLYTAPTDEALKYDIEVTKKLGFNMARKHVKVEPERWYYWARQARPARLAGHAERDASRQRRHAPSRPTQFERELKRLDRRPPQSSVHRDVGAVQRGLGPVRHAADRRSG